MAKRNKSLPPAPDSWELPAILVDAEAYAIRNCRALTGGLDPDSEQGQSWQFGFLMGALNAPPKSKQCASNPIYAIAYDQGATWRSTYQQIGQCPDVESSNA